MDYEKKYKDALERAREWYNKTEPDSYTCIVESIFPELKESEDERIRKELIRAFQSLNTIKVWNGIERIDIIAWLEKQGNKPQGKSALEGIKEEKVDNTNKVEHKFKVGDWIVNQHGTVRHIEEVGNVGYQTDEGWLTHDCYEKDFHLWTIQDAKDGDVLSYENEVFIVKKSVNLNILYYCCYDGEHFIIDSFYSLTIDDINNIRPATKEQRDQLKKAMVNAGYEWDADKKELKKIESQQAEIQKWSEEDENNLTDTCVAIRKFYHRNNGAQDLIDWLKSLKERETWKPSDKQIRALRWVLNNIPYNKYKEEISGLLDQIKDL